MRRAAVEGLHVAEAVARRSDIRLKQDIVPLVRLNNGLELYRFRYKGSDQPPMWGSWRRKCRKSNPAQFGVITRDI